MKASTTHPQPEQRFSAVSLDSARAIASEYIARAQTEGFDAEDVLRDAMDDPWYRMTREDRDRFKVEMQTRTKNAL